MTKVTDERAAFEKWVRRETELDLERQANGEYAFAGATDAWSGWQAAISSQGNMNDRIADSQWIAGAQFGFTCGHANDNAALAKAIEGRRREIALSKGENHG